MTSFSAIIGAVGDIARASGLFEAVIEHEPKSAPGSGLTAAVYSGRITPVRGRSGLASTAKRYEVFLRVHLPMLYEPQDDIDPIVLGAADDILTTLSGDYSLGSLVAVVDLFGAYGEQVYVNPGYVTIDTRMYRVADIFIPVILSTEDDQNA